MGLTDLETIPETGAVFTIGRSRFADNIASHFFIRKDPVVSIACGDEHSAVICQSGRLFVFGSNNWGQLGLGHKNHISKPSCVKALKPEKVTHVACGRAHTLICTGAEKIFACGSDQEGQLGRGTSAIGDSVTTPVLVYDTASSGSRVVQIAAGSHHSLALTNDGNVFAWGSNLEGQLGLPDVSGLVNKPTKVNIPEPVKEIGTGYYHSTFLTDSGVVYVCGESESGKLGIDVSFSTQVTPKQMQLPIAAILVACGGHHTVILAENGNLYCTGSNSSGQLGLGTSVTELHTPKLLPRGPLLQNETISQVSCGESHTAIVTESGKLFTCGDGRHAKLGLEENENNVHELTFVPNYKDLFISKVACGGCHTILVGLKRATNNHAQDVENTHTEHLQKRNSLPPLKLPANRRQSEPRDEKIDEVIKDHDKPATEFTSTSQPKMETTIENDKENVNNNDCVTITNNVSDSMKSIGETDKSVENTRKSSHEMLSVMTPKATTNVSEIESKSNELLNTMEPVETKEKSGNEKSLSTTEKSDTKEETEVNSHEEKKTAIINDDEVDTANNNDTKTTMNHSENEEKTEKVLEKKQLDDNINHSSQAIEEKAEFKNEDNIEERTSSEKQRNMSPLSSSPPPKPPRLKSENTNCSTDKENESIKMENEIKTEEIVNNESQVATGNDETKRNETGIVKSPAKSASSNSMKTKAETEDTMLIEEADEKEKMIVEGKMCNDNAPDDSDVQSPPPRTGKMSKIFKTRKPQPIENGAKSTGTESHKSKSKTCILL